jgi:hypothetical protein
MKGKAVAWRARTPRARADAVVAPAPELPMTAPLPNRSTDPPAPSAPRRSRKRLVAVVALAFALAAVGAAATLGRGKGYKTQVMKLVGLERRPAPKHVVVCVNASVPLDGERNVRLDATITLKLNQPHARLDPATLNGRAIRLVRESDGSAVAAVVTRFENRKLQVRPVGHLAPNARYVLQVTEDLRDTAGAPVLPFAMTFTTADLPDPMIRFERVALTTAGGAGFTCVRVGPDRRLYAGTDDGRIFRFPIEPNGALGVPQVITALQDRHKGPRLLVGFAFDPHAPIERPVLWVTHNHPAFADAPDLSSAVSRMSGTDLAEVEDVVVRLPRSIRDHLTNQPAFGPDGALYFPQGSMSAYGAPCDEWGRRDQHLLSATILRLDVDALKPGQVIDALTPDAAGTFDPGAPGSPLTIYATGIRNAYDLVWHSNGMLYAPVNGSQPGGSTPPSPDGKVPALSEIAMSEDDWLFKVDRAGRYFGHPNKLQGHYVLNGGNPTDGVDFAEVPNYPVGTRPDPAWVPATFNFGQHVSPNGVIEYTSDAFDGRLKRRLLVCRYNVGSDIIVLALDEKGEVRSAQIGVAGLGKLANPLDLAEDPRNGNLYVSEYGAQCITLLRAAPVADVPSVTATDREPAVP